VRKDVATSALDIVTMLTLLYVEVMVSVPATAVTKEVVSRYTIEVDVAVILNTTLWS
jgi:hypothetical protein